MRKKTLEQLRAGNAARQARWRAKHKWLAEQRRLALYGKSKADVKVGLAAPASAEEMERYGELRYENMALVEGDAETVRRHARIVAKHRWEAVPEALMEPKEEGGPKYGHIESDGADVSATGRAEAKSVEEKRVLEELEVFKAKRVRKERCGVEVELVL